jgi:hypothetical protein
VYTGLDPLSLGTNVGNAFEEVIMRSPSRLALIWTILFTVSAIMAGGCFKKEKEKKEGGEKPDGAKSIAEPVTAPVLKASQDDCVGPLNRAKRPKELTIADRKYRLDGYLLEQLDSDPDEELVIGVLSDTKENTEENRQNLDRILDFFEKEKVEIILHLGDVASLLPLPEEIDIPDKDEKGNKLSAADKRMYRRRVINKARREAMARSLENVVEMVSVLADTDLPVLVIIGNRECKTTFNSAMATLAEDYPNVFNLNMVRRVDLDDLDIVSMPGYHDPEYVHCSWDKCLYYESDTLSIIKLAKESNDPVLLVSHGPPRQKDRNGIDVVSEGANVGNPWLTSAIEKAGIAFGAFGNIQEAGGKATSLDGTSIIAQNQFVDSLFLNPGPADSMIWSMNDGTESKGMAAVVHFVGKKAKYKIFRIGQESKTATEPESGEEAAEEPKKEEAKTP